VRIVTAGFYSMQNTKTPVKIAVVAMLTNIILSLLLLKPMKHNGLALANAAAASVNFIILFFMLRKKLGRVDGRKILNSVIKISFASAMMGVAGWATTRSDIWRESGRLAEKAGVFSGVFILCIGIYLLMMHLMKSEEMKYLIDMYKERKKRK
jgi:putative peptidoglycan lipid II flippase